MQRSIVEAVTEDAARQHGAISTQQLERCGMSAKRRRRAVASGWIRRAGHDVYVLAGSPPTWRQHLQIGLLELGDRAWVSHEAAATLHGLDRALPESVEFCVPRERRGRATLGRVHTTTVVGRTDVLRIEGMRCSSATRTIIDLAALDLPVHRLEAAIDSAVRLRLSSPQVLARRLADLRGSGRAGVRTLDRLMVDTGGESMLERRFLQIVRRAGLPRPVTQRIVRRNSDRVARVDFCFEEYRVVVEVTGQLGHSSPSERRKDAQRRNELLDLGFRVYEYTWSDVVERPDHVARTMSRRLRAAGHLPATPLVSAG